MRMPKKWSSTRSFHRCQRGWKHQLCTDFL